MSELMNDLLLGRITAAKGRERLDSLKDLLTELEGRTDG